jgi:hypothetical protein
MVCLGGVGGFLGWCPKKLKNEVDVERWSNLWEKGAQKNSKNCNFEVGAEKSQNLTERGALRGAKRSPNLKEKGARRS